jgi:hypothetical protein
MYYSRACDNLIDLHVDDGYVAGPKYKKEELYGYLESKVSLRSALR